MARSFTSADAKRLTEKHDKYISGLSAGKDAPQQYRADIVQAAKALAGQEVLNVLSGIPVEEINRERRGFRVKALRDSGFSTIADLAAASVYNIASVHGISEDSAYSIKRIVNQLA